MPAKGKIIVTCIKCKRSYEINKSYFNKKYRDTNISIVCTLCVKSSLEVKQKLSMKASNKALDPEYKKKQSDGIRKKYLDINYKNKISKLFKSYNLDTAIIAKRRETFDETLATTDLRQKMSERSQKLWSNDKFRESVLFGMNKEDVRNKMAITRQKQPRISNLENILSKILSDTNIKYERNVYIWPYQWDFLIQRGNSKPLLIEVNGDYWHRKVPHVIKNDKSKRTYFENNLFDKYDLKYLWEHEFLCHEKIVDKIKYWVGINNIEFNMNDVKLLIINDNNDDVKVFLNSYHYLGNKPGFKIGGFLDGKLIAVSVFSHLVRQESATREGFTYQEVLELSRFCIAAGYHQKNFASWMLSRCVKLVFENKPIKALIAFSDTTISHFGTIYKATNWCECGHVPADYWYIDKEGHYMHKKTLYNHAVKMAMKEAEFAEKYGYEKVTGMEKIKFIKHR